MFGRQDSKQTDNSFYRDNDINKWVSIAAALPNNKSDPWYLTRTYLHIKKNLLDFAEFRAETAKQVRMLAEDSRKAVRSVLASMYVYFTDEEVDNYVQSKG